MLPVTWTEDGFPVILPKGESIPFVVDKPNLQPNANSLKGNFTRRDNFSGPQPGDRWLMLRTPGEKPWWKTGNGLQLQSASSTIYEPKQPALLGVRQQHLVFDAETEMSYLPDAEGDIAGLVCYQKENHNIVFGKTADENGKYYLSIYRAEVTNKQITNIEITPEDTQKPIRLKVAGNGAEYSFYYSFDKGKTWLTAAEKVDATHLNTKTAGGFSGVILGLYHYENLSTAAGPTLKAWDKGAFETGKYRNYFAEMGYAQAEIDQKLDSIFNEIFFGKNRVYFEVDDSTAYISDIKNHDVRTEGMSYGMMIAVQLDRRDIFDKLWRWSVKHMQHKGGSSQGYFAWSCKTDGTRNARGSASDGELYYVTSLIFASNRWGNNGDINYLKEARHILDCAFAKDGTAGVHNFINTVHKLITFVPEGAGSDWTDPSYHIPTFYEVWAKWADDGRSEFWKECADSARVYLHRSVHPATMLNPDQNHYDGSIMEHTSPNGMVFRNDAFRYDSWRVPMNIALDYSWSCADKDWQQAYADKFQDFLYLQGVNTFIDQYKMDGSKVDWILPAGNHVSLRHSLGLVATSAAVSLAANHAKSREFVNAFWHARNVPFPNGFFDAYYDGLLQLFAFMHLSGNYKIITSQHS
jgi:oligosaccharide reducing-end xylanase